MSFPKHAPKFAVALVAAVLLAVELLLFEWRPRSFIPVAVAAIVGSNRSLPVQIGLIVMFNLAFVAPLIAMGEEVLEAGDADAMILALAREIPQECLLAKTSFIAVKHDAGEPLTAMKATMLPATASQSTMHRKLTMLLNMGMVKMVHKDNNRRTKFIEPTEKAEARFCQLGQAMGNLLASHRDSPTPHLQTAHH